MGIILGCTTFDGYHLWLCNLLMGGGLCKVENLCWVLVPLGGQRKGLEQQNMMKNFESKMQWSFPTGWVRTNGVACFGWNVSLPKARSNKPQEHQPCPLLLMCCLSCLSCSPEAWVYNWKAACQWNYVQGFFGGQHLWTHQANQKTFCCCNGCNPCWMMKHCSLLDSFWLFTSPVNVGESQPRTDITHITGWVKASDTGRIFTTDL